MAISAISSVNVCGYNKNTSFTGNKELSKKNGYAQSASNPLKAIPLAALIAMSPLNSVNLNAENRIEDSGLNIELVETPEVSETYQSNVIVKSKSFKDADGVTTVKFISSDGNRSNFEKVIITETMPGMNGGKPVSANYEVKKATKYNYKIQADDGLFTAPMPFVRLYAYSDGGSESKFSDKRVCDYIASELVSSRNNSNILENVVNRNLRMAMDLDYTLQNVPKGNIISSSAGMVNAIKNTGSKLLGTQAIEGDNGMYEVKYYSMSNDDRVQLVTLKGKNFPHLMVSANLKNNVKFEDYGNPNFVPQEYSYSQIVLMDEQGTYYSISDQKLSRALDAIYAADVCDKVYDISQKSNRYMVMPRGTVSPMHE